MLPRIFNWEFCWLLEVTKRSASAEFQKAVQLAPGLVEAHRALARLAADSHDWPTSSAGIPGGSRMGSR